MSAQSKLLTREISSPYSLPILEFMVKFNKGVTQAQKDKYIENLSSQLDGKWNLVCTKTPRLILFPIRELIQDRVHF